MKYSSKLQVGVFILIGALLFGIGIFFIGDRKKIFSHNFEIYTEFANLNGLQTGSKVRVSGMDAGEVLEMYVPAHPNQRFRLKIRIQDKLKPLIRLDSVATIETEGLVGNEFLQVNKGSDQAKECPPGGTIPSKEPLDFAALMQQANELMKTTRATIDDVGDNANQALKNISSVAGHADTVVVSLRGDLKQITAKVNQITGDVYEMVEGIKGGKGVVGRMLVDQQLSDRVAETVENARGASASLNEASGRVNGMLSAAQERDVIAHLDDTLQNTQAMTKQLRDALSEFLESNDRGETGARTLRDTVVSARQAINNLADDTEALKHNFLLRGFFNRRGFFNLTHLTPQQYRETKFLKENASVRVWLSSAELFNSASQEPASLSDLASSKIDASMSEIVSQLPNSGLMVEGYSSLGNAAQQYRQSERRAMLVRNYLIRRFNLTTSLVGTMPLGSTPPHEAGKATWDGVSLVIIKEGK